MNNDPVITAILAAFERDPDINTHETPIRVTRAATLRLEGEVRDIIAKRKALRVAARTAGTESIEDRIRVRPGEPREDRDLLNAALNALGQEPAFRELPVAPAGRAGAHDDERIEMSVTDGTIALRGRVRSLSHRRLAEVIAWWVPGCRDVDNRLQVEPPEQETDDELSDVVRLVLDKDPSFDAGQVRVTTRNREITVDGYVHSEEVKRIVSEDCWSVPGVHDVHNRIVVRA